MLGVVGKEEFKLLKNTHTHTWYFKHHGFKEFYITFYMLKLLRHACHYIAIWVYRSKVFVLDFELNNGERTDVSLQSYLIFLFLPGHRKNSPILRWQDSRVYIQITINENGKNMLHSMALAIENKQ